MNATEDEVQTVDAGWGDAESPEAEVDQAWDSLPPSPLSGASSSSLAVAPATTEVDSGWDDVPDPVAPPPGGKRRPHRPRRSKSSALPAAVSPALLPRPAAPVKKHQRDQARQARLHEAQVQKQRKAEKKAQRAAEAREEAAERQRQAQAEERARQMRREARERAQSERPVARVEAPTQSSQKAATPKAARAVEARAVEAKRETKRQRATSPAVPSKRAFRPGVILVLLVLAAVVAGLALRK